MTLLTQPMRAAEPARDFFEKLRRNGLHSEAIEYLQQAAKNPNICRDVIATLPYELAVTLLENSLRKHSDPPARSLELDQAESASRTLLRHRRIMSAWR